MRPRLLLAVIGLALLAVAGCAGQAPEADTYYRLQVTPPAARTTPLLPGVLAVSRFSTQGMTSERALLYSYADQPDQLLRYGYHLWTDPPPVLLQDQMVNFLRAAHVAPRVLTTNMNAAPAFIVEGRLRRFEQVAGPVPKVVVEADISLVRLHGSDLLLLNTYHVEQPIASDQPAAAVAGFQTAVGGLFSRFLDDLSRLAVSP